MATIYQKTPSDKCIILEPGEVLTRPMALPATWSHIRLAVAVSLTGLSSEDSAATSETLSYLGEAFHFYFGISSGSIGVNQPGSKFIGISDNNNGSYRLTVYPGNSSDSSVGNAANSVYGYVSTICENGVSSRANLAGYGDSNMFSSGVSSQPSNYACIWVVDIQITDSGGYYSYLQLTTSISTNSNQSSFSDSDLRTALSSGTFSSPNRTSDGQAFWPARTTPDVDTFYFSLPLNQNRVRIHNYGYLVIA